MFTPKFIDPLEYAGSIAKALDPGVLLTTRAKGRTNTMTIGWGTIGVEGGRPGFVAFVRTHRFAPAIAQLPLTLECKVIYRQHQEAAAIPPAIREKYHPQDVEPDFHGRNRDFHTAYYGEIVSAYILE